MYNPAMNRWLWIAVLLAMLVWTIGQAGATELHVVSSGGFAAAYKVLAPQFEHDTGNTLVAAWGPSMGDTKDAVPQRLARTSRSTC